MTAYPYSVGNILDNPQKYQMTPYEGSEFLRKYKKSRQKILEIIYAKKFENKKIEEICLEISPDSKDGLGFLKNITEFQSKKIFSAILYALIHDLETNQIVNILDTFLKKFELKKRIFSSYDINFKENSNNYSDFVNYLLLVTSFLFRYESTNNLKYLNVILKINDTLCSQIAKIDTLNENILLKHSLEKELIFVKALSENKGLDII